MTPLQGVTLLLVAAAGAGVAGTRDPLPQSMAASFHGILLAILFVAFEAPDVALSQIVVGAVLFPLMLLLALAKIRGRAE
ncbi:MAG: DUF4040 domain-containing protein [Polyangiaceae bacterium]|nr:DUF4040 domain-containing protein [Polyangiaceae bacterium]